MTVYVDDMHQWAMGQFGKMKMSHMIADNLDELHSMADAIGIKRKWFQDKPSGAHYDIAMSKRKLALAKGAVPVTLRTLSCMCFIKRVTGKLPTPDSAEVEWRTLQRNLYLVTARRKAVVTMRDRHDRKMRAVRSRIMRERLLG